MPTRVALQPSEIAPLNSNMKRLSSRPNSVNSLPGSGSGNNPWDSKNILIHERLGRGASGAVVHRCSVQDGPFAGGTFAVKIMKDCVPDDMEAIHAEIETYERITHPNVIKYLGTDSSLRNEIRLFMEYIPLTLEAYLASRRETNNYFQPKAIADYMLQLCQGIGALHELRIVHRDIKPSNIFVLLNEGQQISRLKIGDFDISKELWSQDASVFHTVNRGTARYRAPEMNSSNNFKRVEYDFKVDVWSAGMVLFAMITLTDPYERDPRAAIGLKRPEFPAELSAQQNLRTLMYLFEECTSADPARRLSIRELISRLETAVLAYIL